MEKFSGIKRSELVETSRPKVSVSHKDQVITMVINNSTRKYRANEKEYKKMVHGRMPSFVMPSYADKNFERIV